MAEYTHHTRMMPLAITYLVYGEMLCSVSCFVGYGHWSFDIKGVQCPIPSGVCASRKDEDGG